MGPSAVEEKSDGKSWETMNFDEKLDYLKKIIEQFYQLLEAHNKQTNALRRELIEHRHDEKGIPYIKQELGRKSPEETMIYGGAPYGLASVGR